MASKSNILKDYECEGQMNLGEIINDKKSAEISSALKECESCLFWKRYNEYGTLAGIGTEFHYACSLDSRKHFERVGPYKCSGDWKPGRKALIGCCATCKYSNCFIYEGDHQDNPIEEPNIYCDHPEGSLNRRCVYPEYWTRRFGVGTWHRQHEYDTCDRYEKEESRW